MGLAKHNPGGHARLGLSGTAGSAVLYSAIVVFGIGSASPSALDVGRDRNTSVVLVPRHADIVPGSVKKKLPQASPEPGRHRSRVRPQPGRTEVVSTASPAPATAESPRSPAPPRGTESSAPPSVSASSTTPVAAPLPTLTAPTLTVPELPLPELPVQLPLQPSELPVSSPLPLDLPG